MATPNLAQDENPPLLQISAGGSSRKSRGDNYSDEEDIILVNGWLTISLDGTVGTDQKFDTLWNRIHAYYHECKKPSHQERSKHSLGNRWSNIRGSVNKFCACLAQVEILNPSDSNETDKIRLAGVAYKDTWRTNFSLGYCWEILRYHPKWILQKNDVKTRKKRGACSSSNPENIDIEEPPTTMDQCVRPPGRNALKAEEKKRKHKEEKSALFEQIVSSLKEERKQQHDEKMEKFEKLALLEEQKVAQNDRMIIIKEKRLLQEEKEKINQIMLMDISQMDAVQEEFFMKQRLQILQNMYV